MAKVLVVEDNEALSETIKDVLETNGHTCVLKYNVKYAIKYLENNTPNILIFDYYLPDGNSVYLIKYVRNELKLSLPIIGMSAIHEDALTFKVLEAGAHDQIKKPFKIQELLLKVNNYARIKIDIDDASFIDEIEQNSVFVTHLNKVITSLMDEGKLSLESLADKMGYSTSGISKKIKRATAYSYFDYTAEIKIKVAKKLIAEGNLNVSEVANKLGFKRLSHFSVFFKSRVGVSPKQFEMSFKE